MEGDTKPFIFAQISELLHYLAAFKAAFFFDDCVAFIDIIEIRAFLDIFFLFLFDLGDQYFEHPAIESPAVFERRDACIAVQHSVLHRIGSVIGVLQVSEGVVIKLLIYFSIELRKGVRIALDRLLSELFSIFLVQTGPPYRSHNISVFFAAKCCKNFFIFFETFLN